MFNVQSATSAGEKFTERELSFEALQNRSSTARRLKWDRSEREWLALTIRRVFSSRYVRTRHPELPDGAAVLLTDTGLVSAALDKLAARSAGCLRFGLRSE